MTRAASGVADLFGVDNGLERCAAVATADVPSIVQRVVTRLLHCPSCLDTQQCWLCDGSGSLPRAEAGCPPCFGSGACHDCASVPAQRAPDHDVLPLARRPARDVGEPPRRVRIPPTVPG